MALTNQQKAKLMKCAVELTEELCPLKPGERRSVPINLSINGEDYSFSFTMQREKGGCTCGGARPVGHSPMCPLYCKTCNSTGTVNAFDGRDTGGGRANSWPAPCPDCTGSVAQTIELTEITKEQHDRGIAEMEEVAKERLQCLRQGIIPAIELSAGDKRVMINGWPLAKAARLVSEGQYQALVDVWRRMGHTLIFPQYAKSEVNEHNFKEFI